jgi:hypothetical protein
MTSLEWDSLVVLYYLSISEICPDQEGGFVGWGLIKKEGDFVTLFG